MFIKGAVIEMLRALIVNFIINETLIDFRLRFNY